MTREPPIKITVTHKEYMALLTLLEEESKENIGLKELLNKLSPWDDNEAITKKDFPKRPLIFVIIIGLTTLGFYFANFYKYFSDDQGDWGTFGDFFGGVMNPILGFINLFLLSTTLSLQIKSSQNQDKNTQIQEISARIVAIGHLLDITSQQIKPLSEQVHLLKQDELKNLELLKEHYSAYLSDLHKQYNNLKDIKG